jgi:diaminohydroxyphosphoribosylaminopyrimidine deaminase / 5-amino-6-(5-phosphoribosylamino)uracil reductase
MKKPNAKPRASQAIELPAVTLKFAQTLDGRIATATGNSQWISSPASRRLAHQLRCEHDAILIGIGTALADDPQLNVRLANGRDPLRVIVDSRLRLPLTARVIADGAAQHTLVATTKMADPKHVRAIKRAGAEVLRLPAVQGAQVDLRQLLTALARRGIRSVLVEGGAQIITSFLSARLADRIVVFIAPKIIGKGTEAIGDLGITRLQEAIQVTRLRTRRLGPDIVFDGQLRWPDEA